MLTTDKYFWWEVATFSNMYFYLLFLVNMAMKILAKTFFHFRFWKYFLYYFWYSNYLSSFLPQWFLLYSLSKLQQNATALV